MKITLAFAVSIILFASCRQAPKGVFEVNGTILNAPGKKLLLMEIPYSSPQPIVLDSTTLNAKGEFTLKGMATEEGIYRLTIDNGPDVILVNDKESITVNMDVSDYQHYKVEGSPASESLSQLFQNYRLKDSILLGTFIQLDTLQKQQASDSILAIMRTKRDNEVATLNGVVVDFINKSTSPAASFYAIGLASRTMQPAQLKPLADAAAAKFTSHSGLARVKSLLTTQLATPQAAPYKLLNAQAPDLTMPDLRGKNISISQFKGKYLLVDFWASWCGPCRGENPNVVRLYSKYKSDKFEILGVSLDQEKAAWQQAIAKDNLTWPQMSDLKYWESAAVAAYGFDGIPFNVLIDPDGKIIANGLIGQDLENKLEEILK